MVVEFHDTAKKLAHENFQRWRRKHKAGYYLTLKARNKVNLHISTCWHAGDDTNTAKDIGGSLTAARKVCSPSPHELEAWAKSYGFKLSRCQHCMTRRD